MGYGDRSVDGVLRKGSDTRGLGIVVSVLGVDEVGWGGVDVGARSPPGKSL